MNKTTLFYGMKLKNKQGDILTVGKYWVDDTDAMAYKVRLGQEAFYSSDLVNLIEEKVYEVAKMEEKNHIELAGKIIDLLIKEGAIEAGNPYAVENWAEDYLCNHSNLFKTDRFETE